MKTHKQIYLEAMELIDKEVVQGVCCAVQLAATGSTDGTASFPRAAVKKFTDLFKPLDASEEHWWGERWREDNEPQSVAQNCRIIALGFMAAMS